MRVHSLQFGCLRCKKRFTQCNKANIEQTKHNHQCIPRPWGSEDPEWMDEEQESRLANWNGQGHAQESGADKWSRIFKCIFQNEEHVPDPCQFLPSHTLKPALTPYQSTTISSQNTSNCNRQPVYKTPPSTKTRFAKPLTPPSSSNLRTRMP
jgi:hypothetical protein